MLVRPFSTGFDLASVEEGAGVRAQPLISREGQELENQLQGLHALVLQGEFSGSTALVDGVEQALGAERPLIYGLDVAGQDAQTLIVGYGYPGPEGETYIVTDQVQARGINGFFDAPEVRLDEAAGTAQTLGPTQAEDQGQRLFAEEGIWIDEGGQIDIR